MTLQVHPELAGLTVVLSMLAAGVFLTMIKYIAVAKSLPITAVYPHRLNDMSVMAASIAPAAKTLTVSPQPYGSVQQSAQSRIPSVGPEMALQAEPDI
jgi:hypothetical protein